MKKARLLLLLVPIVAVAIYMRSLASWRPQKVLVAEGPISGLVFSGDGKTLLAGHLPPRPVGNGWIAFSPDTTMALDVQNGFKLLWKREHDGLSNFPRFFSHDSKILAQPGAVEILDAHTGKAVQLQGLNGACAVSPDGNWLAYYGGGFPGQIDAKDGRIYLNRTNDQTRNVAAQKTIGKQSDMPPVFCFSPDSLTLAVGTGDAKGAHIDFYSTKTWKLTRTWSDVAPSLANPRPSYLNLQWSRDGGFLFSSLFHTKNQTGQHVWRVRDAKKVASGSLLDYPAPHLEHDGGVLTFGGDDGQVNLSLSSDLNHHFKRLLHLPNQKVTAAALSPDGTYLVAGTRSGTIYRQRLE